MYLIRRIKSKLLRVIVRILLTIFIFIIVLTSIIFVGGWYSQVNTNTKPFVNKQGSIVEKSIASYERIEIGGVTQSILIRGKNIDNPVLLFLHGGPGSGIIGQAKANAILEEHFTVVYWDQYGASKSYSPFLKSSHLTINQFIKDGHELTQYIKNKLSKKKIILLGHSWGSILGMHLAYKYPNDYIAFIGVGQVVNFKENFKGSYEFSLSKAKEARNDRAITELEGIYGFWNITEPRELLSQLSISSKWMIHYGGYYHRASDLNNWYKNPFNDEFTVFDAVPWLLGQSTSVTIMFPELFAQVALESQVPKLEIPYFLLMGKSDYNTPWYFAENYFNKLEAPFKKLYWFYESGHEPMAEEPEKFNQTIIDLFKLIQNTNKLLI